MTDFAPLGRRIGFPASDVAWTAHADMRKQLLRERFGPLVTDKEARA